MKVLRRATKKVYNLGCPICNSRLQAEESDVKWYVEKKIGHVTCPVCGCEHVPVVPGLGYQNGTIYENEPNDY